MNPEGQPRRDMRENIDPWWREGLEEASQCDVCWSISS